MKFKCESLKTDTGHDIIILASKGKFEERDTFHATFGFDPDAEKLAGHLQGALNGLNYFLSTIGDDDGQAKPEV